MQQMEKCFFPKKKKIVTIHPYVKILKNFHNLQKIKVSHLQPLEVDFLLQVLTVQSIDNFSSLCSQLYSSVYICVSLNREFMSATSACL